MMNTGPKTTVSLLLGTIICLGAFFLIDNNIPAQALHKEEQILESYDSLADFANAVKSGDEEDLEEIPIQSMEAADIYDDADDTLKDCIDLAAEVGDSLTDREVVHCVDDANYFENKYTNSTVPVDTSLATSTSAADTNEDTSIDTKSASDTSASDTSASDTSASDTSASDTSASDTSASDTSASDDVTGNSLINELVNTGKFTEDEAKQFVSQNMLSGADTTSSSDDTSSNANADDTQASNTDANADDTQASNTDTNADDTQASNTDTNADDTQASNTDTNADDTQASNTDTNADDTQASNNEENQADSSDSNNSGNPEDYDSLSELVSDIKNGVVDTDEIPLNDFQNSGAYQGADEQTQDCIDLAAKIGSNLIDYEIVRCSDDPNHFKNQIANNGANNNDGTNNENSNNNDNNN
jgi:polyhydroxyalkanoate synthesis regulator phasin